MKTKIKRLPKAQVELRVEIDADTFEKFLEKALFVLSKDLEVPGFRKGQVPKEIALREIGKNNLLQKAAELAIREKYLEAVLEYKLEVISQPKVEILKLAPKNPFCFRAIFTTLPEISLPDWRKLSSQIVRKKISVKDSEVEEALTWLQKSRPKFKELEREAKKGDFVEIEFSSPQIEGRRMQKDAFLLGKGHLIKGFEEKLVGMKKGEEKTFSLFFPKKHFQKKLAGKKVDFKVKMVKVSKVEFPEINDQFAREVGNFENLARLRQSIKEGIKMEKELAESQRVREEILKIIEKNCEFEIPEILIETEKQRMLKDLKTRVLRELNLSFKDYLEQIKKSEKEILDSFETVALEKVKRFLILREIAKRENIEVSDEEVREEMNKILEKYPSIERAKQDIDLERLKDYTKEKIRTEKTLAKLESFTIPNS